MESVIRLSSPPEEDELRQIFYCKGTDELIELGVGANLLLAFLVSICAGHIFTHVGHALYEQGINTQFVTSVFFGLGTIIISKRKAMTDVAFLFL